MITTIIYPHTYDFIYGINMIELKFDFHDEGRDKLICYISFICVFYDPM